MANHIKAKQNRSKTPHVTIKRHKTLSVKVRQKIQQNRIEGSLIHLSYTPIKNVHSNKLWMKNKENRR